MSDVIAFKDWAAVCDAMGRGRQSLIVRKGGIAEGRDGFQFKHPAFFLYPTAYHEQLVKLRPGLAEGLQGSPAARDKTVEIRDFFRLEWAATVTDWPAVRALEPFHLYRDEVVRERFDYDGEPGVQVAFGRAYRLVRAWIFPAEVRFGGCRSWLKFPPDAPDLSRMTPAINDATHAARAAELEAWLTRFAITASRFPAQTH